MKYRKKPVVIEAFQMTSERMQYPSVWPDWLHLAWDKGMDEDGALWAGSQGDLYIATLEGDHFVTPDDWIIRGVKGELYPCKPDIFEMTYEAVEDGE